MHQSRNRAVLAPMTFEGDCNNVLVEAWVEQCLVLELKLGQVVIFDNASFHKSSLTHQLIEQAGCTLLFLSSYSPDFNKIEEFWATLKHHFRKTIEEFYVFWDADDNAFREFS